MTTDSSYSEDATNLPLLESTQTYLQSLLERQAPDSVLSEAWDEFYRVYSELIRRFVFARGVPAADVDDCVQEVWSTVAQKLVKFQHPKNRPGLRAWLYTVVRSKVTDIMRQRIRQRSVNLDSDIPVADKNAVIPGQPGEADEAAWLTTLAEMLLEELRPNVSDLNYQVVRMRLFEGRSVSDVAAALDITPEQVRSRQHRLLSKLRVRQAIYTGRTLGESCV